LSLDNTDFDTGRDRLVIVLRDPFLYLTSHSRSGRSRNS
jgi:hypothetical protein